MHPDKTVVEMETEVHIETCLRLGMGARGPPSLKRRVKIEDRR